MQWVMGNAVQYEATVCVVQLAIVNEMEGQPDSWHKSSQVTFIYIALLTIQIVSKQQHNIKIGSFFKAFHYWIQWCHCPAQFSLNTICAIKSVISLEMKCPQLSKPEATRKLWYNLYPVSNLICSECTLYSVPWWPLTLKVEPWAILVICYIWTSSKSRQNECAKCLYIYIEMCSRDCFLFQGARKMLSWHIKVSVNICKCMTKKNKVKEKNIIIYIFFCNTR